MGIEKTTVSIGFKADTQALETLGGKTEWLEQKFKSLANTVKGVTDAGHGLPSILRDSGATGKLPTVGKGPNRPTYKRPPGSRPSSIQPVPRRGGSQPPVKRGFLRKLPGAVGAVDMTGTALGAVGIALTVTAGITKGIQSAMEYNRALDSLTKRLSIVGNGQEQFVNRITRTSSALGIARKDLLQYTQAYVAQAGTQKGHLSGQINTMGNLAKGMGMDKAQTFNQMGGLANAGAFGSLGKMRANEFAALIADGVSRGSMKGREGEVLSSINTLVNTQMQMLTKPEGVGGMVGALTSMNQSGRPGLMGNRGANVLSKMNNGIMNPGGGEFGEMLMYNAIAPGENYYDFKYKQEEGAFGDNKNLEKVMASMKRDFPDGRTRQHAMKTMFGISMHQADGLEKALRKAGPGQNDFLDQLEKASGGDLGKISADKYGLLAEINNSGGDKKELKRILSDTRLKGLKGVTEESSKEEIFNAVSKHGMLQTVEEQTATALVDFNTNLERLGLDILPLITALVVGVNEIVGIIRDHFGGGEKARAKTVDYNLDAGENSAINSNLISDKQYAPNTTRSGEKIKFDESKYGDINFEDLKSAAADFKESAASMKEAANKFNGVKFPGSASAAGDGNGKG